MSKNQTGFTLVELAIVLMIIGLLIGGILRGQELLNNAKITHTVEEVKAYQGAVVTFRDAYFGTPGDTSMATTHVPGCIAANFCTDGNGDGVIGTRFQLMDLVNMQTGNSMPAVETTLFWKELASSHLITGVDPSADPAKPAFGKTHPAAKIGGGWLVAYGSHIPSAPDGTYLVLSNTLTGASAFVHGQNVLSPIQARQIDNKMDDGIANLGDVSAPDDGSCDDANGYRNVEEKDCTLVFHVN